MVMPFEQSQPDMDSLIVKIKSDDSDERRLSVYALESYPRDQIFPYLVEALQDECRGVREAASEIILQIPAEKYAQQLVSLLGSPRIEVRNLVAEILVQFGKVATSALIQALTAGNEDERKFAADILGLIGDDRAVNRLSWVAEHDPEDNVVIAAIEAIGKIKSVDALPLLQYLFLARPLFQPTIAEAMGLIGDPSVCHFLESHLNTQDPVVAFGIVDALGNLGQASSVDVLVTFYSQVEGELRHQTAKAVLKIARKAEIDLLTDLPSSFWNSIANLLIEGDSELEEILIYHIQHSPSATVISMMWQMVSIAPESLLITFINIVRGRSEFLKLICQLCHHDNPNVAYQAIESLTYYPPDIVAPHLKELLGIVSGPPLIAALEVIAAHRLREFIPLIQPLCQSDDLDVQLLAEEVITYLNRENVGE